MSELNNVQVQPTVALVNSDGRLMVEFFRDQALVTEGQTAGKGNGLHTLSYLVKTGTKSDLEAGKGFLADLDGTGEQRRIQEVSVKVKYRDDAALTASADAKRLRGLVSDVRKAVGLTKVKTPLADRDLMTSAEFGEWIMGSREFKGFKWEALPALTKDKLIEVRKELAKRGNVSAKPASPTQVMQALAAALDAKGLLDDDSKRQVAELLARQERARAAKAAPKASEDVELTEQAID